MLIKEEKKKVVEFLDDTMDYALNLSNYQYDQLVHSIADIKSGYYSDASRDIDKYIDQIIARERKRLSK